MLNFEEYGELINICDPYHPLPPTCQVWSPNEGDGTIVNDGELCDKLLFISLRTKKMHFERFMEVQMSLLKEYADEQKIDGNLIIVKKDLGDEWQVGFAIKNAFCGVEIGET
jgi:hypothetical protein